ncbi:Pyrophosphate--fructose 6-phosphate 1-phosphotransferase subunit alpha [Hibiscus syriacus]|uniref:Pyrophosphate--fructose 6-phosphate 1-phosphotransferase subunit alpha n=1 Tax=Hibiscus syriacus TaxID=106335 RepID=A0A6A2YRQ2_HIBSY|nr:bZIP transcription factor 60-like [Hibiscus syriacus]KAE8682039.1 Pyrophosphate--fructose 6-phosphate 1-phosphotransferase subunit alpha [Hibiscus syriacus]
MEEINWDTLFLEADFPDFGDILQNDQGPETEASPQPFSTENRDLEQAVSSWMGEIEKALMEDDHSLDRAETQPASDDDFFADLLADSPPSGGGGVAVEGVDFRKQNQAHTDADKDDPVVKKQRRQLRNRDAAVRSRERKKIYVKDLEMKSRYLEGECRRLSHMLQFFIAENQALRLTLHKGGTFDASSGKQESAVLLLESLLLGSLLWFLGIMCLFALPTLPKSVPLANEETRSPERVAPRGVESNPVRTTFMKSRRCKASREKLKEIYCFSGNFSSILGF